MMYTHSYFISFMKMLVSAENIHWDITPKIFLEKILNRKAAKLFLYNAWVGQELAIWKAT